MTASKKVDRLAGLIYLVVVLTGIFSLMYVPSSLVNWKDPAETFQNITNSQQLFRLSIASSMLCYIAFLLLPLVLYKILHGVNEQYAKLMVILAIVSVPMSFINLQHKFAVLNLVEGAGYLDVYNMEELQAQVMQLLDNYNSGLLVTQIFWGLWLFPFGYLVYKSGVLPKILGILLMLGCIGYLLSVFANTIFVNFHQYTISKFITLPATLGEIGSCLWLLIFGRKSKKTENG